MSPEIAVYVIPCVAFIFTVIAVWAEAKNSKHREDKKRKKHDEDVTGIFVEIGDCFAHHGFVFGHKVKDGKHSGRILRDGPGVFISFSPFLRDCYEVKFERNDGFDRKISLHEQRARDKVHREVIRGISAATDSLFPDSRWFWIDDIFELRKIGIKGYVDRLVAILDDYEKIWSNLESCIIIERLAAFLKLHDEEYLRYMQAVDIVIDRNSPKVEKTEVPS